MSDRERDRDRREPVFPIFDDNLFLIIILIMCLMPKRDRRRCNDNYSYVEED